jgi:hypothetical protein
VWHVIAMLRGLLMCVAMMAVVGVAGGPKAARADGKPGVAPLEGAVEVLKRGAPAGFIDDVVAADDTRLGYVLADASTKAELHVVTVANQQEAVVDLASVTLHPVVVRFVGNRAFVVGQQEDGNQIAALVELAAVSKSKPAGTVVYKLGPAKDITLITRDGKPRIAVHRVTQTGSGTRHDVELVALETGKRVQAGKGLELDASGANKKLELRVNHWSAGFTLAHGIKGGEWDKKEDQRTPDVEATYDLLTGKFVAQTKIEDLFEQRKRFQALAVAHDRVDFLRMAWDNSAVQIWHAGKPVTVALDQPITNYDPKSLQGLVAADGSAWFILKMDPVNPDAVARKKADPEYVDVFHATADGKATRKARVLEPGLRVRFGVPGVENGGPAPVNASRFWLLERSSGFERGGKNVTLFQLQ